MVSHDQLTNVRPAKVADSAFAVIDAVGKRKMRSESSDAEALMGMVAAVLAAAEAIGYDNPTLLEIAGQVIKDSDGKYIPEFRAIRRYLRADFFRGD